LFALVRRAREEGLDPEAELRAEAREFRAHVESWADDETPDESH
jgi:hypothetical protein